MEYMALVWFGLVVLFAIGEAASNGLVSIWFAGGAVVALVLSLITPILWIQITTFLLVSTVLLALTRPLAQKYVNAKREATNADRIIGKVGIVTDIVNNREGTGEVKVDGKFWTARTEDDRIIFQAGTEVNILRIEGVKVIVSLNHD